MGDKPTSEFHAHNRDTANVDRLVAVLDQQEAVDGVRRLRDWAQGALGVRPGERAVDVGAGTGSQIRALALLVGADGDALGVEAQPGLRAVAGRRAAEAGSTARFSDGDAVALPLPDASVDVVWCERVLQHLSEPERAVAEIARVLRPGGRVALLDTDWATMILHPGDPGTVAALTAAARSASADPYSGRKLGERLSGAGLAIDDRGSQALIQDQATVSWPLIRMLTEECVRLGAITEAQRDRLYTDLAEGAERGALHLSVTMFATVAHRPE